MRRRPALLALIAGSFTGSVAGCRGAEHAVADAMPGDPDIDAPLAVDASMVVPDAMIDPVDGAPFRLPCTGTFGTGLTSFEYGRLDGILVAIVPPSSDRACHPDAGHLHLQIRSGGLTYDIAVNVGDDVHTMTIDRAAFQPAWADGWHTTGNSGGADVYVDYPGLGIHSTIPLSTKADLISAITADLATVNHISIYATSYDTQDGAHLVHFNGGGHDGMIVTRPLSATSHMRVFSFDSQMF